MKRETTDQLPGLKKSILKHSEYAVKSIQELLPARTLDKAVQYEINTFETVVFVN